MLCNVWRTCALHVSSFSLRGDRAEAGWFHHNAESDFVTLHCHQRQRVQRCGRAGAAALELTLRVSYPQLHTDVTPRRPVMFSNGNEECDDAKGQQTCRIERIEDKCGTTGCR